jgi:2'-5' RNA ligase
MHLLGFEKDRQNFVPHLTVGRIRYFQDKALLRQETDKYKSIELQRELVNGFYLYESNLKPTGPVYKIVESFNLLKE